ncbi:MAG TPA: PTS sugar transporter subunit IIA [Acidobacteriota bacterium]|nr:PTS sugar transporter subunit IIA [Acidobacteriota bacterium]
MKLSEIVSEDLILPDLHGTDTPSVLREFADAVAAAGKCLDANTLYEKLLERENQESTGIGNGVAIPHCKLDNLKDVVLAIGYSRQGVGFRAIDGNPTFFFFVVLSPSNAAVQHLRTLAALSRLLKSQTFLTRLWQRPSGPDLIALIRQEEDAAAIAS